MTLAEIRDELAHIVERRGSDTSPEERIDMLVLDDLRSELDVEEADHADAVEVAVELRGRIEILMNQIQTDHRVTRRLPLGVARSWCATRSSGIPSWSARHCRMLRAFSGVWPRPRSTPTAG